MNKIIPFFNDLTEKEKEILKSEVFVHCYRKGQIISTADDKCTGLLFVVKGRMRLYITSDKGAQITVYRVEDKEVCVFSAACLIKNLSIEANIEFEQDTEVLLIPKNSYQKIENNPKVKAFTIDLLSERLSDVMWIFTEFVFSNTSQRLADNLLQRLAGSKNTIKVTHEELANDLGTAREVVTRILRHFQKDKIIRIERGKIEVINIEKLMKI